MLPSSFSPHCSPSDCFKKLKAVWGLCPPPTWNPLMVSDYSLRQRPESTGTSQQHCVAWSVPLQRRCQRIPCFSLIFVIQPHRFFSRLCFSFSALHMLFHLSGRLFAFLPSLWLTDTYPSSFSLRVSCWQMTSLILQTRPCLLIKFLTALYILPVNT